MRGRGFAIAGLICSILGIGALIVTFSVSDIWDNAWPYTCGIVFLLGVCGITFGEIANKIGCKGTISIAVIVAGLIPALFGIWIGLGVLMSMLSI